VSSRCIGEPVSWLLLERFHLGEIEGEERERIAQHVAACAACAACLGSIQDDEAVALPPLALPESSRGPGERAPPFPPSGRNVRALFAGRAAVALGGLAAAAAVVLAIRSGDRHDGSRVASLTRPESRIKGDAIAFSLVRDDDERILGTRGVYRDGDRFKAILTCPPGSNVGFDVVVYDVGGVSFPLDPAPVLACGNEVPIPGAFRLTGSSEETVCLVWSEGASVDRGKVARVPPLSGAPGGAGDEQGKGVGQSLCKRLSAAPKP
jgi:hypothetical protein